MSRLATEGEGPRPPRINAETSAQLHRTLDALEHALTFAALTEGQLSRLEERFIGMQNIAEAIGSEPGSIEDREVACAKIELFAQQCDVIARAPVMDNVPVLEGGRFDFTVPGATEPLVLPLPCLRARGEGSLELFEDVDAVVARVGDGGAVLAGNPVEVLGADAPDDSEPGPLPEGDYQVELVYLALDASRVQVRLLDAEGAELVKTEADLSPGMEAEEVDLGLGLALTLDRIPSSTSVEIENSTLQTLSWRHDCGERLNSLEGWFHETVQPRDFELYALFLEEPLKAVRKTLDAVDAFRDTAEAELNRTLEVLGDSEASALEPLSAGREAWSVLDTTGLINALNMEE